MIDNGIIFGGMTEIMILAIEFDKSACNVPRLLEEGNVQCMHQYALFDEQRLSIYVQSTLF